MYRFFQVSDLRNQYYKNYKEDESNWIKELPYHASHAIGKALGVDSDHNPQDCPHCFKTKRHTGDLIDRSVPLRYQHQFLQSSHLIRVSWSIFIVPLEEKVKEEEEEIKALTQWDDVLKYHFDCKVRLQCSNLGSKHVVPTLPNMTLEWEELCRQLKVNDQVMIVLHGKSSPEGLVCSDHFYLEGRLFHSHIDRVSKGCKIWILDNTEALPGDHWCTFDYKFTWDSTSEKIKGTKRKRSDEEKKSYYDQCQVAYLCYSSHLDDEISLSHAFHMVMNPAMYRLSLFMLLKRVSQRLPKSQVQLQTNTFMDLKKVFWGFG